MKDPLLYHVTLLVPQSLIGETLEVCNGLNVRLVSVAPTKETAASPIHAPSKTMGYVGGKKNKGISSEALVLQCLNSDPKRTWTSEELGSVFESRGFARHSFTAATSKLVSEGKCRRIAPGLFAPIGLSVHMGASA